MARYLILAGVLLIVAGLAWPWLSKLPLGRLPGDFVFGRGATRVYLPLASCLLVSVLVTLVLWFFRR